MRFEGSNFLCWYKHNCICHLMDREETFRQIRRTALYFTLILLLRTKVYVICNPIIYFFSGSHHLERVEEPGQLVEPLRAVVGHPIADDAVQLVDVGETQFIKVLLTLQSLDGNF